MSQNKVEIALKLLKDEFVKDSKTASNAWAASMKDVRAESDAMAKDWANNLKKVESANNQLTTAQRKAANERKRLESARSNLGVTSLQSQNREVAKLTASYNRLATSGKLSSQELTQAQEALRKKVAEVRGEVVKEGNALKSVGSSLAPFIGVGAAALFAKRLGGSAISAADDYARLNSQIRLVTDSEDELASTNEKLFRLAQETRSEFSAVTTLYTRTARATTNLNLSQQTLLDITRSVNQAMQISGATTQESSSAVIQFTQALQSGVLRGEEFNSISENGARLLTALADGLDVPIEKMRELAEAGELTRDKLIAALTAQSGVIAAEYENLELTVDQALTQLGNSFQRAIAESDTSELVKSIQDLQEVLTDPTTIESLTTLTNSLVTLTSWAANASTEFTQFASNLGEDLARAVHGPLDMTGELTHRIERLKEQLGDSFTLGFGRDLEAGFVDDNVIQEKIDLLEKLRAAIYRQDGVQVDERSKNEDALAEEQKKADKIVGINKQIATAKQNIAAQQVERSKIIAAEELKIAKQNGGELISQIKQEQSLRQQAINDRLTAAKQVAKDIINIEKQIVDEKLALQERLNNIDKSVDDKLFERSLSGESENTQQILIEQQATEKLIEAKKALKEGRLDDAASLSQEAQGLSDRISNIDRANALLVEGARLEKETLKTVTAERVKADEVKIAKLQEYKKLQEQAAGVEQSGLDADISNVDVLAEKLEALGKTSPTIKIDSNITELTKQVEKLVNQLNSVASAGFNAGGQISGFRTGGKLPGYNTGGSVGRQLIMAEDGEWYLPRNIVDHYGAASIASINQMRLSGFQEGGKLPGYGGGDRRLMNPQVGGFIIRKEAARKYGDGFMSDLLSKKIPKFNTGGGIRINPALLSISNLPKLQTGGAVAASSAAGVGSTQRHEVVVGAQQFDIFGEQDQVTGLLGALAEVSRGG